MKLHRAAVRRLASACIAIVAVTTTLAAGAKERVKNTQFKMERGALVLPGPVAFEAGGDAIKPESEDALYLALDFLDSKAYVSTLRVEGHTDAGDADANQALSERRALAVAKWLVAHGADCKRLLPVGFGQNKPVAANDTPQNKAANRRIEFLPAAIRGKAIGGQPLDGGGKVAGDACR